MVYRFDENRPCAIFQTLEVLFGQWPMVKLPTAAVARCLIVGMYDQSRVERRFHCQARNLIDRKRCFPVAERILEQQGTLLPIVGREDFMVEIF